MIKSSLLIIIAVLIVFPSFLHAQSAQEYYQQGIELKNSGKIDEAIKAFDKAIGRDRKFGEAYLQKALLYKLKKTPAALKRATDTLIDAMRIEPENVKYKITLGEVYIDRTMFVNAKTMFDRALELDPNSPLVLAELASWYAREAAENRYRVSYDIEQYLNLSENVFMLDTRYFSLEEALQSGGIAVLFPKLWDKNLVEYARKYSGSTLRVIDLEVINNQLNEITWDEFTAKDDSTATAYNFLVLELNPDDRDAMYRQGLLYFDNDSLKKFAEMFEHLVNNYPDDKDGHLFLGLAYFRTKEYEKAYGQFEAAKHLMPKEELDVFSNVGYLKVGGLKEKEIENSESDTSGFWYIRDPLYLTSYNEREMEHYCRVAEANLRFSVTRLDIEGWNTEQGKFLIKYGPPEKQKILVDLSPGGSRVFTDRATVLTKAILGVSNLKYNFWYYPDFTFAFETQYADYYNRYKLSRYNRLDFVKIAREVEKKYPEFYKYEPKGQFIDFAFDVAGFRGEEGKTKIELYYGIPTNKLHFNKEDSAWVGKYRSGVFLHDENWARVLTDIQIKDVQLKATEKDTLSDNITIDRFIYMVQPGTYNLAFEMQDQLSDNEGTFRDTLNVERYGYERLQMSDILPTLDIYLRTPDAPITRENLFITPNPHRAYLLEQPIYIYYEIYNLLLDDIPGNSDYTVEYKLRLLEKDRPWIVDFVRKLVVNEKQDQGVASKFTARGSKPNESQFIRFDHSIKKPGPYELQVKITDNISGSTVEKLVILQLFERK
ncbi:hypothetical protein AMJ80_06410 [bacterium SM23_31]|nr:MAG: hypothetical protein AMJ80_06410 [bacterium SM23_31]